MRRVHRKKFSRPADTPSIARDFAARGYCVSVNVDPPGRLRPDLDRHGHGAEVLTVLEGLLEVTCGDDRCVLGPGDELALPGGTPVQLRSVSEAPTRWLHGWD